MAYTTMRRVILAGFVFLAASLQGASGQTTPAQDGLDRLVLAIEAALQKGDPAAFLKLVAPTNETAAEFAEDNLRPGVTRAVVRERDRLLARRPGATDTFRLVLEVFVEHGRRGRVATWTADIERDPAGPAGDDLLGWRIAAQERLTTVDGLHRLELASDRQFDVSNLTIEAEDLILKLHSGTAFVADADSLPTALVFRGRGEIVFEPRPRAERGQLRIFAGTETLRTEFDAVYLRINPGEFDTRIQQSALSARPVDQREFARANALFAEHVGSSFGIELGDLSRDTWSLVPTGGDILAEVHTRRFDTLTYARSGSETEDITLFDRKKKRNIALYASEQKLASRGEFYSEDDRVDYDVLEYNIDAAFAPERQWIDARAYLRIKVRSYLASTFTVRLAEELTVRSISAEQFGRLLHLRVRGQDNIVINLPAPVQRGTQMVLTFDYSGRILPQEADREAISQDPSSGEASIIPPEPRFLYSNRSYWYPQSTVTDYATATIRIVVPGEYGVVATGEPAPDSPQLLPASGQVPARRAYVFNAPQPVRYVSCVISRFARGRSVPVTSQTRRGDAADSAAQQDQERIGVGVFYDGMTLGLESNPRQQGRMRDVGGRASKMLQFYASLLGDFPYQSFTLALVESQIPGGHSPPYFAVLHQPLPTSPFAWRSDPVNFDGFPDFFLAHEIAHQWWGQAIGWKNYHEQWLSEGFSQYFAALYARHDRGEEVFTSILRQMRKTAADFSDQGPVYLGYRLGHLQGQGRIFRALVYNKGAVVLHMLRRLVGDDAFFRALRGFYERSRFTKVGTDDLRQAFEAVTGRQLSRFFDRWIYGETLPQLTFSYQLASSSDDAARDIVLRFAQGADHFDVPVTVSLTYANGSTSEVVVAVQDAVTEVRVPLAGVLRSVNVNADHGALAEIRKK